MSSTIMHLLELISKEAVTVVIAAAPGGGARQAIRVGSLMGLNGARLFPLSFAGNFLPIVPVLFLLEPVSNFIYTHWGLWRTGIGRLAIAVDRRSWVRQVYGGLVVATIAALPFSLTGVWAACLAASFFRIRFRYAFPAITFGTMLGGGASFALYLVTNGKLPAFFPR
ncbi:MAG: small multi-drug export protein [Candidatus Omnitrophota bacterium]